MRSTTAICSVYDTFKYSDKVRRTINRRLIELTRGARGRILLAILVGLGVALINVTQLSIVGYAIGQMFSGISIAVVLPLLLIVALLITFRAWLTYLKEIIAQFITALTMPQWFNPSARLDGRSHDTCHCSPSFNYLHGRPDRRAGPRAGSRSWNARGIDDWRRNVCTDYPGAA